MKFFTAGDVLARSSTPDPKNPVTIDLEDSIQDALGNMFDNAFSQLPVLQSDRVVGVVTYQSICQLLKITDQTDIKGQTIKGALTDPNFVDQEQDIFDLFETFAEDEYVLIGTERNLEGIITQYDVFHFLKYHVEPFLKIGEIEQSLRTIFLNTFPAIDQQITETFADRAEHDPSYSPPADVAEFDFGEYHTFVSRNMQTLPRQFENDRDLILELLDEVREIRNALFHFRAGVDEIDRQLLDVAHNYFTGLAK